MSDLNPPVDPGVKSDVRAGDFARAANQRVRNTSRSYFSSKVAYNIGRLHGLKLRIFLYRKIGMKIGKNCVVRRADYLGSPKGLEVGEGSFIESTTSTLRPSRPSTNR
jgi:hypothetical protein